MFSRTAAPIAAASVPPAETSEAEANWAEPANVVAEKTTDSTGRKPASRARTPNVSPNAATASASGATARAPAPTVVPSSLATAAHLRDCGAGRPTVQPEMYSSRNLIWALCSFDWNFTRSPIETTPATSLVSVSTGRWRMRRSVITAMHSSIVLSRVV